MVVKRSGQLNPARLVKALVELCGAAARIVFSDTWSRASNGSGRLQADDGACELQASSVVVPSTPRRPASRPGFRAGRAGRKPYHRDRATAREDREPLLPNRRTGADGRHLLAYFRRTPDGTRFLYGAALRPSMFRRQRAAAVLYRRMVATLSPARRHAIRHAWGCKVGFTFDGLPHLGEINGLHTVWAASRQRRRHDELSRLQARAEDDRFASAKLAVRPARSFRPLPLYGRAWFLPLVSVSTAFWTGANAWRAGMAQSNRMQTWMIAAFRSRVSRTGRSNDMPAATFLPELTREKFEPHLPWLVPVHYDAGQDS